MGRLLDDLLDVSRISRGRIETSASSRGADRSGIGRDGREVLLRFRDNGIGIAPEILSRIFDPFVQVERRIERSQGRVGIGLTLVRKLVE